MRFGGYTLDNPLSGADGDPEGDFRIRSGRPGLWRKDEASVDPWDAVDAALDGGWDTVEAAEREMTIVSGRGMRRYGEARASSQRDAKQRHEETRGSRAAYMREYRRRKKAAAATL